MDRAQYWGTIFGAATPARVAAAPGGLLPSEQVANALEAALDACVTDDEYAELSAAHDEHSQWAINTISTAAEDANAALVAAEQ